MTHPLLSIKNLNVRFVGGRPVVHAVRDVSLDVNAGEVLGLVGESGSGKSALAGALMGLHSPAQTQVTSEAWRLGELDLKDAAAPAWRGIRGQRLAMVFQDPMTSLNPYMTLGAQLDEVLSHHTTLGPAARQKKCIQALHDVGLSQGQSLMGSHPHLLSGGMRQRVVIAMALLAEPDVLIADEPTTALDVTVQAQILALLMSLCEQRRMAMVLITHDLAVLAGIAHQVAVMYAGRFVELAPTAEFYRSPKHPYSRGLLQAMPDLTASADARPAPIEGSPPPLDSALCGCPFAPRCKAVMPVCHTISPEPEPQAPVGWARCHNPHKAPLVEAAQAAP